MPPNDGTPAAHSPRDEGIDPTPYQENQNMHDPTDIPRRDDCGVPGCQSYLATHAPEDDPTLWSHELAPLDGHGFDIYPVRSPDSPWTLRLDVGDEDRSAADITRIMAVLLAESERLEILNRTADDATRVGQSLLADLLG